MNSLKQLVLASRNSEGPRLRRGKMDAVDLVQPPEEVATTEAYESGWPEWKLTRGTKAPTT